MYKISQLEAVINSKLPDITKKVAVAQERFCKELCTEIKNSVVIPPDSECRSPQQFEKYRETIRTSDTLIIGNQIETRVFSDMLVYWPKKGISVPIGAFLEWGTGPLGQDTNTYPHDYPYTIDNPWDMTSQAQYLQTGTWGMQARPHFYPTAMRYKSKYIEEMEKVINE